MKYAILNGLLGGALLIYGMTGAGWWLGWLGLCFGTSGIAYAKRTPSIFGKRVDGTLPVWSWIAFLPLHGYTLLIWHLLRLLSKEPAWNKLTDSVTIGRRLLPHELPDTTSTIVDLTAEFQEPHGIRAGCMYHSFPILDAATPDAEALRRFIGQLPEGPVYIHCAQGHGRTALFASALLVERRLCSSSKEAQNLILKARPGARTNREQEAFLRTLDGMRQAPATSAGAQRQLEKITTSADIDFPLLWSHVIAARPYQDSFSVHGPDHWRRVERNGLILATRSGAKVEVVRLFAIFHDCRRLSDGWEPTHGKEGAKYAATLRGIFYHLSDEDFALLREACENHTSTRHHTDPTIGTCWDADRLDLGRVGRFPIQNT